MVLALGGCAEPFDETRQDLLSFRIAALGVQDGMATAAVWSGEGLFHTQAPTLDWTLNGVSLGSGWQVPVVGYGELGLAATAPDGDVRQARLTVAEETSGALGVSREAVSLGDALGLEDRRAVSGDPVDAAVPSGSDARLALTGRESAERLRWMLGGGVGALLELDDDRADLVRAELAWEEGELADRDDLGDGPLHVLAVALDDAGSNRWLWADAVVGAEGTWARHEGRLIASDGDAPAGWLAVTLAPGEGLAGVSFTESVPVSDLAEQQAPACAPADLPFRLAWVAEGRCALGDVLGARVVVEVW